MILVTETTIQTSYSPYTILNDRVLWYDGDSSYNPTQLKDIILNGDSEWAANHVVDIDDFHVKRFNQLSGDTELHEKEDLNLVDEIQWVIPTEYKRINIKKYIFLRFKAEIDSNNFTEDEIATRSDRILLELKLWKSIDKLDLLNVLVYIIDTFEQNDIVWGTGRGSSCCSYILYLIGVHDVDSVAHDLDIKDFFR